MSLLEWFHLGPKLTSLITQEDNTSTFIAKDDKMWHRSSKYIYKEMEV